MAAITVAGIEHSLASIIDPYLDRDLITAGVVKDVQLDGRRIFIKLELGYPLQSNRETYLTTIADQIKSQWPEIETSYDIEFELTIAIVAHQAQKRLPNIRNIKNIVAVASGKGGVGKSTTAVNLALALQYEGARVGILDADIYGPSVPLMLGIGADQQPEPVDEKYFSPIEAHGLQTISIANFISENTPVVWRGPKVSGALQQLLMQTLWQDLDYLIIDMPPGTGDIQLTLAQTVPVTGAVVVTTPQDIALLDAKKGIEMFRKVDVSVLGVVENMSLHTCSKCGHTEAIFGEHGGQRIAQQYETQLLGALPLAMDIRLQTDSGAPTVAVDAEGVIGHCYLEIAKRMAALLSLQQRNTVIPNIQMVND